MTTKIGFRGGPRTARGGMRREFGGGDSLNRQPVEEELPLDGHDLSSAASVASVDRGLL